QAIDAQISEAAALEQQIRPEDLAAARALCATTPIRAASDYDITLEAAAATAGLELEGALVEPDDAITGAPLAARVSFTLSAPQEPLMRFLSRLGQTEPALFVRRLDLVPREGRIEARIEGAIWCAA